MHQHMKTLYSFILLSTLCLCNVNADKPFKCNLFSNEHRLFLSLDLYHESIDVPGMDMFGPMAGYLNGDVYGIWIVTSAEVKNSKKAILRLSNDLGSETQLVELTRTNDSTYVFQQKEGVVIKKVVDRKLQKIPAKIIFKLK